MVRYVKASGNVQTLAYLRKHTQGCGGRAGSDCMERAGCGQEGGVEFAKAPAATSVPYGYHLPHSCQSLPHSGSGLPCVFIFFQKDLLSCFSMLTLMFLNVGSELKNIQNLCEPASVWSPDVVSFWTLGFPSWSHLAGKGEAWPSFLGRPSRKTVSGLMPSFQLEFHKSKTALLVWSKSI